MVDPPNLQRLGLCDSVSNHSDLTNLSVSGVSIANLIDHTSSDSLSSDTFRKLAGASPAIIGQTVMQLSVGGPTEPAAQRQVVLDCAWSVQARTKATLQAAWTDGYFYIAARRRQVNGTAH